jgi:hypothetical protein
VESLIFNNKSIAYFRIRNNPKKNKYLQLIQIFGPPLNPCSTLISLGPYSEDLLLSIGSKNVNKEISVRSEVFKAVTMKNGVFWDVTPCGSCKNQCFGGT